MKEGLKKKEPLEEVVLIRMTSLDRRAGRLLAQEEGYRDESQLWRRLLGQVDGKKLSMTTISLRKRYDDLRAKLRNKKL